MICTNENNIQINKINNIVNSDYIREDEGFVYSGSNVDTIYSDLKYGVPDDSSDERNFEADWNVPYICFPLLELNGSLFGAS